MKIGDDDHAAAVATCEKIRLEIETLQGEEAYGPNEQSMIYRAFMDGVEHARKPSVTPEFHEAADIEAETPILITRIAYPETNKPIEPRPPENSTLTMTMAMPRNAEKLSDPWLCPLCDKPSVYHGDIGDDARYRCYACHTCFSRTASLIPASFRRPPRPRTTSRRRCGRCRSAPR